MHILWSCLAYSTRPYFTLWEVFQHQKRVRLRRIWERHDCHEGAVIPGTYINIHGEIVKIDSKNIDPDTEVMRLWPLFHRSSIPSFHVGGIKPLTLKDAWFQYIIEIPRRYYFSTSFSRKMRHIFFMVLGVWPPEVVNTWSRGRRSPRSPLAVAKESSVPYPR